MNKVVRILLRKARTAKRLTWSERSRLFARTLLRLARPPLIIVYYPAARLLAFGGVRFLVLGAGKLPYGHLAHDPMFYLKGEALGLHPRYRAVFVAPRWKVVNVALARAWRDRITVVSNPVVSVFLTPFTWIGCVIYNTHFDNLVFHDREGRRLVSGPATDEILHRYAEEISREPLITVRPSDVERGWAALRQLGMSADDWWVCLHARETGYYADRGAATEFRNSDPATYLSGVQAIVDRGGWVIRIGDPSMTRLPPMEHVIDYVHTDLRADWMELFLIGGCRFMLASNSGPIAVAWMYGRPLAAANLTPMSHAPLGLADIYIPKLYWSADEKRLLKFSEMLLTGRRDYYADVAYERDGVQLRDNTPEEIRDLTLEMLDRCDNSAVYTSSDDQAQAVFWKMWEQNITTFSFGKRSRVGRDFLRRHAALMEFNDVHR